MGIMAIFGTSGRKHSQRGVGSKTLISLIRYTEDQREHFPTEFPAGTSGTFRSHYFVYVVMYLVLSFIYLYLVSFLIP